MRVEGTASYTLITSYLTLLLERRRQWEHSLYEVFNWAALYGEDRRTQWWRLDDRPSEAMVYQRTQRWLAAGCFEALAEDLRTALRLNGEEGTAPALSFRVAKPSRRWRPQADYNGAKHKKSSKLHSAVKLGRLPALHVAPVSADDRSRLSNLPEPYRP
jgi:hypothetical protein